VRPVRKHIAQDQVHIIRVGKNEIIEDFQRKLGKFDGTQGNTQEFIPFRLVDAARDPPRQTEQGMNHLAHHRFHHLAALAANLDHF